MRKMLASVQGTGNHTEKKEQTWSQAPWGPCHSQKPPPAGWGQGKEKGGGAGLTSGSTRLEEHPPFPRGLLTSCQHCPPGQGDKQWPRLPPQATEGQGLQARGLKEFWEAAQSWSVQYPTAHPMKSMFTTTDVQQPKPDMKQF